MAQDNLTEEQIDMEIYQNKQLIKSIEGDIERIKSLAVTQQRKVAHQHLKSAIMWLEDDNNWLIAQHK